jgi:hemerythrin
MLELFWDSSMDVQLQEMNSEHKRLIEIMNRLSLEFVQKFPRPSIKSTLEELVKFTTKHFSHEEKELEAMQYPEIETHKKLHAQLLSTLNKSLEDYKKGTDLDEKFFEFLHMWLKSHIRGLDVQYGKFYASKSDSSLSSAS